MRKVMTEHYIRVSKGLDPDQNQQNVCPELGPNCMHRLSADNTGSPRMPVLIWILTA